ncbi:MAG: 30S ribosomal protein S12 methylthiotransferase RimO, partial [Oscillospiraceae bacterium]|nr:30S ribosomal protein S12 methylthiotransferase RimO [Oscillospiraceae bacterium]
TAAECMERIDADTAAHRAALVAGIQSRIMDDFNQSRIGSATSVLIEGHNGANYYGRSYAESPEVDGLIFVRGEGIEINDFVDVRIIGIENGDPLGELLN